MSRARTGAALALALLAALIMAGCGTPASTAASNPSGSTPTPVSTAGATVVNTKVATINGKPATVLADANGKTLYYFTPDSATQIACTGACAQTWPPLLASGSAPTSGGALPGKLSVLNGANGQQVLYNGHPLYTYAGDQSAGDVNGQGLNGKWFAATPTLATQDSSSGSSGYNY